MFPAFLFNILSAADGNRCRLSVSTIQKSGMI